jgi:hypothetical protein
MKSILAIVSVVRQKTWRLYQNAALSVEVAMLYFRTVCGALALPATALLRDHHVDKGA